MQTLLHISTRGLWQRALEEGVYTDPSLEREGFIHCSLPEQVAFVASSRFRGESGLILLCIDADLVGPEIRYEGEIDQYPHIYGPLNLDAVYRIVEYEPGPDGTFTTPDNVSRDDSE
jgi:uncharacterized protein (DUF952 family)